MFIKRSKYNLMEIKLNKYEEIFEQYQINQKSKPIDDNDIDKYKTSNIIVQKKSDIDLKNMIKAQMMINSELEKGVRMFFGINRKFILANKEEFEKLGYEVKEVPNFKGKPMAELR